MASPLPVPGKRFVIGVPYVWLFVFFLLPFLILLYISFVDQGESINPFKPIWDPVTGILALKYENYWEIFRDLDAGGDHVSEAVDALMDRVLSAIKCRA